MRFDKLSFVLGTRELLVVRRDRIKESGVDLSPAIATSPLGEADLPRRLISRGKGRYNALIPLIPLHSIVPSQEEMDEVEAELQRRLQTGYTRPAGGGRPRVVREE